MSQHDKLVVQLARGLQLQYGQTLGLRPGVQM